MISKLRFGHHPSEDESQHPSRIPKSRMEVTWPSRRILVVNLSVYNDSEEPIAADIRLYLACFDGSRKPPPKNPEDQVKLATTAGPKVFWGGQVIPDAAMCSGGVWTSGATALELPEWTEHVVLVAKLDKPREPDVVSYVDLHGDRRLLVWRGQCPLPKECTTQGS